MKGNKNLNQIKYKQVSAQMEVSTTELERSLVNPSLQLENTLQDSIIEIVIPQNDNDVLDILNALIPIPQEFFNQPKVFISSNMPDNIF